MIIDFILILRVVLPHSRKIFSNSFFNLTAMKTVLLGSFKKLIQSTLGVYTHKVVTLMSNDVQFAPFSAQVSDLKTALEAYDIALRDKVQNGRLGTIEKNKCKAELLKQLTGVAILVDILAKGNENIIAASGFDVRKPNPALESIEPPFVISVTSNTEKGDVDMNICKVEGAVVYNIQKRFITKQSPDPSWDYNNYQTDHKFQLKGCETGQIYEIRIRTLGQGTLTSAWSSIYNVMIF